MNESPPFHHRESEVLREMSIRELIAELKTLQDQHNHESAVSRYRPLRGHLQRRAVLERRERRIITELDRRRMAALALQTA